MNFTHKFQGVCHRDIKCENILLDDKMVVKLIDFGFAKCFKPSSKKVADSSVVSVSTVGTVAHSKSSKKDKDPMLSETYCGSYAYACPEILKGIPYNPFLSDVWATGCVLFAMVFGRLPFDDRDPTKLIKVRKKFPTEKSLMSFSLSQQISLPLKFPSSVKASASCKDCIQKILAYAPTNRHTLASLKTDDWINSENLDQSTPEPPRKLSTR